MNIKLITLRFSNVHEEMMKVAGDTISAVNLDLYDNGRNSPFQHAIKTRRSRLRGLRFKRRKWCSHLIE